MLGSADNVFLYQIKQPTDTDLARGAKAVSETQRVAFSRLSSSAVSCSRKGTEGGRAGVTLLSCQNGSNACTRIMALLSSKAVMTAVNTDVRCAG
jgi:hypothetical protein